MNIKDKLVLTSKHQLELRDTQSSIFFIFSFGHIIKGGMNG